MSVLKQKCPQQPNMVIFEKIDNNVTFLTAGFSGNYANTAYNLPERNKIFIKQYIFPHVYNKIGSCWHSKYKYKAAQPGMQNFIKFRRWVSMDAILAHFFMKIFQIFTYMFAICHKKVLNISRYQFSYIYIKISSK